MAKHEQDTQQYQILEARHHDPFAYLGLHGEPGQQVFRTFQPHADRVWLKTPDGWDPLTKTNPAGLYTWNGTASLNRPCLLRIESGHHSIEQHDPYSFPASLTNDELYLFGQGRLLEAHKTL
uniref:GlgB N-terminal domain-containing protein n=1 Tax=Escherichia coli TaxID=562 RepID=UPI00194F4972